MKKGNRSVDNLEDLPADKLSEFITAAQAVTVARTNAALAKANLARADKVAEDARDRMQECHEVLLIASQKYHDAAYSLTGEVWDARFYPPAPRQPAVSSETKPSIWDRIFPKGKPRGKWLVNPFVTEELRELHK